MDRRKTPVAAAVALWQADECQAGVFGIVLARKLHMQKATVWRHLARAEVKPGRHFLTNNGCLVIEVTVPSAAPRTA